MKFSVKRKDLLKILKKGKDCLDILEIAGGALSEKKASSLNILALAFIGDSVHTLYVRTKNVETHDALINELHRMTSGRVNARTQAADAERILPSLSEEEHDIYRRARNAKINTAAKNASIAEYKKATGLEAVIGYLYITGKEERLKALFGELYPEDAVARTKD